MDLQAPQTGPQSARIRQYVLESARLIPSERTLEASGDPSLEEIAALFDGDQANVAENEGPVVHQEARTAES